MDFGEMNGARLTIEPFDAAEEEIRARFTFRARGFAASVLVTDELYVIPGGGRPHEFFRRLADDWRGWDGARELWDVGHSLHVVATHNQVNGVMLSLELTDLFGTLTLKGEIVIELGQLDRLAAHIESIFTFPTPPPPFGR
jgi:hypothetical protein